MNDVLQCPHCELRFVSEAELRQHIVLDHPDHTPPKEPL